MADPSDPRRVASYETGHQTHNAYLDGDVAYLTGTEVARRPVVVVDVSDDDPREIARFTPEDYGWTPETIHDVYVQDDVLYASYWDLGTWLVDVSDPADPTQIVRLGFDVDEVESSPRELPGNDHYAQPSPDGDVLAIGKEAFDREDRDGAPGGIELWDVSDPAGATRESVLAPPAPDGIEGNRTAHNFGWRGEEASFWTAEPIHEGFVGADNAGPMDDDVEGAELYTFPEPTGEGRPAPTMEPLAPAAVTTEFEEVTTGMPTGTPTATPGSGRSPGPNETTPAPTGTPADASGFGVLATLAAGSLAAWRFRARRSEP